MLVFAVATATSKALGNRQQHFAATRNADNEQCEDFFNKSTSGRPLQSNKNENENDFHFGFCNGLLLAP
jgi:hypothetical protein